MSRQTTRVYRGAPATQLPGPRGAGRGYAGARAQRRAEAVGRWPCGGPAGVRERRFFDPLQRLSLRQDSWKGCFSCGSPSACQMGHCWRIPKAATLLGSPLLARLLPVIFAEHVLYCWKLIWVQFLSSMLSSLCTPLSGSTQPALFISDAARLCLFCKAGTLLTVSLLLQDARFCTSGSCLKSEALVFTLLGAYGGQLAWQMAPSSCCCSLPI